MVWKTNACVKKGVLQQALNVKSKRPCQNRIDVGGQLCVTRVVNHVKSDKRRIHRPGQHWCVSKGQQRDRVQLDTAKHLEEIS